MKPHIYMRHERWHWTSYGKAKASWRLLAYPSLTPRHCATAIRALKETV